MSRASNSNRTRLTVGASDAGVRLDQFLAAHSGLSRRRARLLLDLGGVFVDRARVKVASRPVRLGQIIEFELGGVIARATTANLDANVPYEIVFEDDDLVVVNKPAGVITAPTPESDRGNLADALSRRGAPVFVVHRLDRPTSGLLVFAKSDLANRVLAEYFRRHDVVREYEAVVVGQISAPISISDEIAGKHAVTHVFEAAPLGAHHSRLVLRLETGRSHQIRIHMANRGAPVAGDHQHGTDTSQTPPAPPRLALNARCLGFAHPRTGAALLWHAAWPAELEAWTGAIAATT